MFSIRESCFETNSSSFHTFLVPKDGSNIKIPFSINLKCSNDTTEQLGRIRYMYNIARSNGYALAFVNYLRSNGVEIEEEYDKNDTEAFCNYLGITLKELDNICFNASIIDENDNEFDSKYNKWDDYDHIDISGSE